MLIWRTGLVALIGVTSSISALAAVLGASQAQAQAQPREVLIGVLSIGQPAALPMPADESTRMYQGALASLRGGQAQLAQRQLEQLVARYPDSQSAVQAREELVNIYASVSALRQPAAFSASEKASDPGGLQPVIRPGQPAISEWRTSVKATTGFSKSAQDDFRAAAGDLVFFSEGSAELGSRARKALAQQAEWLKQNPERIAIVEGHADEAGSAEDLKVLSTARAEVVRNRLIEAGVDADRIRVVAHGAERRIVQCDDRACAGQNRRATTTIDNSVAVVTPTR